LGFGFWTLVLSSIGLITTGGGAVIYRLIRVSTSHERRAARIPSDRVADRRSRGVLPVFPTVPDEREIIDSPGIRLAYRLPTKGSPTWLLASAAGLALGWCAICVVLLGIEVESVLSGTWHLLRMLVLFAFGWIGVRLLGYFLNVLRGLWGVGAVIVELSDHPLRPGESYEVFLAQFGRVFLKRLEVDLVCEEEATFLQGTDVRVERHVVRREKLWSETNVRIDPTRGWEQQFKISIPADAMHSFQSQHNALRWQIEVRGESRRWPSYCRSFPVVVQPHASGQRGR
jgi:hypothetical protein